MRATGRCERLNHSDEIFPPVLRTCNAVFEAHCATERLPSAPLHQKRASRAQVSPFKIRFKADSSHDRWAAKAALALPTSMNVSSGCAELRKQESKRKWLAERASRLKQDTRRLTGVTRDQFEQVIINKRRCRCQQPSLFVVFLGGKATERKINNKGGAFQERDEAISCWRAATSALPDMEASAAVMQGA